MPPKPKSSYIVQYTPQDGIARSSLARGEDVQDRIIQIVEQQVDPLQPPKHKLKRNFAPPAGPPPTVVRDPAPLTDEERKLKKVPPCISRWKNNKGLMVTAEQRLLLETSAELPTPNNKFLDFVEALQSAETTAKAQVLARSKIHTDEPPLRRRRDDFDLADTEFDPRLTVKASSSLSATVQDDEDEGISIYDKSLFEGRSGALFRSRQDTGAQIIGGLGSEGGSTLRAGKIEFERG
ncbi:hypothetical protein RCL1_003317 [Eukaryota sp. TZLM3-RCL]